DLEEDATRLDIGDPPLRRALARAHAGLGGLLGERTVREHVDPHLAATLDVTGHRDTSGLDLTVCQVRGRERLDPELAEGDLGAAGGLAGALGVVLLAVLDLAWDEHYADAPSATGAAALSAERGPRRRSPRSRAGFMFACSRASSLLVRSPL